MSTRPLINVDFYPFEADVKVCGEVKVCRNVAWLSANPQLVVHAPGVTSRAAMPLNRYWFNVNQARV